MHAGRVNVEQVEQEMVKWGADRPDLKPLQAHETSMPGDPEYALAYRAIQGLVDRSSPAALVTFCRKVGQEEPWKATFSSSFGVTTEGFCQAFEASR